LENEISQTEQGLDVAKAVTEKLAKAKLANRGLIWRGRREQTQ